MRLKLCIFILTIKKAFEVFGVYDDSDNCMWDYYSDIFMKLIS
jgi:hypothetical protein